MLTGPSPKPKSLQFKRCTPDYNVETQYCPKDEPQKYCSHFGGPRRTGTNRRRAPFCPSQDDQLAETRCRFPRHCSFRVERGSGCAALAPFPFNRRLSCRKTSNKIASPIAALDKNCDEAEPLSPIITRTTAANASTAVQTLIEERSDALRCC